jgi:hypothetical protein
MATTKYKYTSIKDMNENENYNFYGVIYDATFPTIDDSPTDYVCIIKVIDTETNCLNISNIDEEVLTLVIKSNSKESLPFIHTVGDIIRVHRGLYVIFNNLEAKNEKDCVLDTYKY